MLSPTPAVRAALFGLLVVTALAVGGAALHLAQVERAVRAEAAAVVEARAQTAAAALARLSRAERAGQLEALVGDADAVLLGPAGAVEAATDREVAAAAAGWATASGVESRRHGGRTLLAATGAVGGGRLVVLAPAPDSLPDGALVEAAVAAALFWGLLSGVLVLLAWYTGPRTAHQLALLGERIGQGGTDPEALIRHAGLWLGPLADGFAPVADRLRALGARAEDVKQHLAALYQINPHYVVLCTLDGDVVEANPAFYAATGLPVDAVRGGRVEALRETFPVEPLMDLAERSLREGSSISGVEYAVINRDDETRPVEVSLRAFAIDGRPHVLFQATDQAHAKRLERRVAAFTDTLDLMVDQRVHQLTAGQQALGRVLDAAGVVVASFDAGGATSRWNGAAQALTGRPQAGVPHFAAVVAVLGLSPSERTAFTQWFWSPTSDPFIGRHGTVGPDGATRTRQLIWQRVDADMAGRSDLRTLVGVEVPAYVPIGAPSGDGAAGGSALAPRPA